MTLEVDEVSGELETYLSGQLAEGEVAVTDLKRHTEGWSRQTISFTARAVDGDGGSKHLVARVEPSGQDRALDSRNDVETEFETMRAVYGADVPVPVPETYWYEDDGSVLGGPFFLVGYRPGRPVDRERLRYWRVFGAFVMMNGGIAGAPGSTPARPGTSGPPGSSTSSPGSSRTCWT